MKKKLPVQKDLNTLTSLASVEVLHYTPNQQQPREEEEEEKEEEMRRKFAEPDLTYIASGTKLMYCEWNQT